MFAYVDGIHLAQSLGQLSGAPLMDIPAATTHIGLTQRIL